MSAPVPDPGHGRCTHKHCFALSGLLGDGAEKRPNRASRAEAAVQALLQAFGIRAQLKPTLPLFTRAGTQIEPDIGVGADLGTTAFVSRDVTIDVAVEVKVQENSGTCEQKIEASIRRYAHAWDDTGIGAAILHCLCPASVTAAYIAELRDYAHANLIGFLPVHGLTADRFRTEMAHVAGQRHEQATTRLAEALASCHSPETLALAARIAQARQHA